MRFYFVLFYLLSVLISNGQESKNDFLPRKQVRLNFPLLKASYEIKTSLKSTITSQIGLGFIAFGGTNFFTGKKYFEIGLIPEFSTDYKHFFTLSNTTKNKYKNYAYKGLYVSLGASINSQLLKKSNYRYVEPSYSIGVGIGKDIQKNNNWYFSYGIGYNLFTRTIKSQFNDAETLNNKLGLHFSVGYRINTTK